MPITLDHVALASADITPALRYLVRELGGTALHGGHGVGFRPMQVLVGNAEAGMRVELLEPWAVEHNDFLARFVAKHGEGPHHLTFKVPDIRATIERFRSAGFTPVNIDLRDSQWQEAFLMPRQAQGTVVQIAQTPLSIDHREALERVHEHGPSGSPVWWPDTGPRAEKALVLRSVVVATASLDSALNLFAGHLHGTVTNERDTSVDLEWPNGSRLRVVQDTDGPFGITSLDIVGLGEPTRVLNTRFTPAP